jgi:hypothetical protein
MQPPSSKQPKSSKPAKPALAALLALKKAKARSVPPANSALNQQNRRVLAQHYRAKYGVK